MTPVSPAGSETRDVGCVAETLASRFLEARGVAIIARNYRCRGGEIDIVARDGDATVFVEVRLRRNRNFGGAAASITDAKRRRLKIAALHYIASQGKEPRCRFDAIALHALDASAIEWLRDIDVA